MRDFRLFFLESSPEAAGFEVFFAALEPPSVVLAGAFEAVEAGALPAVEAGLGAISMRLVWLEESSDEGSRYKGGSE